MFSYLFTFRSQTAAQNARKGLGQEAIRAQLRRAPQQVSGLGCAWALYVKGADGLRAMALLRAQRQPMLGAYRLFANGYLEVVT